MNCQWRFEKNLLLINICKFYLYNNLNLQISVSLKV